MQNHKKTPAEPAYKKSWDRFVQERLPAIESGVIEITVHNSAVVQVETKQRIQFAEVPDQRVS